MLNNTQKFGKKSESIAAKFLEKNGYQILHQNYRIKIGEIDIIAKENNTIVFVEVKSGRTNFAGNPKWGVTPGKQKKISMVALYYLKTMKLSGKKARFDVVSIISNRTDPLEIELIKNAFELAYK